MTTMPQPSAPSSSFTLKYDAWNRLVEVKDGSTVVQANEYDGLNRRIIRDETGGSGVLTHFYYNQQWQVLEERVGTSTTANKQFVYHPHYVDAIAMRRDASGNDHYFLQDANFNVTAVVDNTGTVKERYAYTPYGEVTILDADFSADADGKSDISNEHLYTGKRQDPGAPGLQLNRNRFYASGLGRWVNRDPIGYVDGYNLYEYVNGMPLVGLDPSGNSKLSDFACICLNAEDANNTDGRMKGRGLPTRGNEGDNGMLHCVIACRINQKRPTCSDEWNEREDPKTIGGQEDLENNKQGQEIKGDCWKGCLDKWKKGKLKCRGKGKLVPCPPPPKNYPPNLPPTIHPQPDHNDRACGCP